MLELALTFLNTEINNHLRLVSGHDGRIKLSPVVNQKGEIKFDHLAITLIHLEEEKVLRSQQYFYEDEFGNTLKGNPILKINPYILISANFENQYTEALKFLGYVMDFFQKKSLFTPQNSPGIPDGVDKLIVELQSLPYEQMNHVWGTIGAKLMPSLVFKIRVLAVGPDSGSQSLSRVKRVSTNPVIN